MPKKIIYIIPFLLLILLLSGCSSQERKDVYSLDEIYSENAYGFYVKDGDNYYSLKQFEEVKFEDTENTLRWYVGDVKIPKVTKKTPLVAVYKKNEDMPEEYFIDKFHDLGYTVGANISIGEDNNSMWVNTSETCPNSHIGVAFSQQDLDDTIEIDTINDIRPFQNIDTDVNILTGLEKNKYYDVMFFVGTQSLGPASICADTRAMKFIERTTLIEPLQKTHDKYFIVTLPENLHKGYYDINGEGMFQL